MTSVEKSINSGHLMYSNSFVEMKEQQAHPVGIHYVENSHCPYDPVLGLRTKEVWVWILGIYCLHYIHLPVYPRVPVENGARTTLPPPQFKIKSSTMKSTRCIINCNILIT